MIESIITLFRIYCFDQNLIQFWRYNEYVKPPFHASFSAWICLFKKFDKASNIFDTGHQEVFQFWNGAYLIIMRMKIPHICNIKDHLGTTIYGTFDNLFVSRENVTVSIQLINKELPSLRFVQRVRTFASNDQEKETSLPLLETGKMDYKFWQ